VGALADDLDQLRLLDAQQLATREALARDAAAQAHSTPGVCVLEHHAFEPPCAQRLTRDNDRDEQGVLAMLHHARRELLPAPEQQRHGLAVLGEPDLAGVLCTVRPSP
jgi:hypothetical protein